MGFVGWIFFLFTFSRVKGVVFNDNNEYLSDSFQHFFSTTSFGGSTDFYEYPKPEVLSAMFYFISGTTVFLAGTNWSSLFDFLLLGAFYFFYTKSHKTLFQNLCTYSLEGNLSDPFKKTLLFLLSLSICVGAFYGTFSSFYSEELFFANLDLYV